MCKDAGLNGDLDRLPQLSWILFLKCYDDLELRREEDAVARRAAYKPVSPAPYRITETKNKFHVAIASTLKPQE